MSEHTLEPWKVGYGRLDGGYLGVFQEGTDFVVARISPETKMDEQDQANARRIVACVNACWGIPTAMLEDAKDGSVLNIAVSTVTRERDEARAMVKRLANALREAANENYRDEWEYLADEAEDSLIPPNVTCHKCYHIWPGRPETCAACGEALHE